MEAVAVSSVTVATDDEMKVDAEMIKAHPEFEEVAELKRLRFLRARELDVENASKMLAAHLEWQKEMNPTGITQADIARSLPSGCWRFGPVSKSGRPMIMVESSLWRPHEYDIEEYQRMVCYFMSKAEIIMDQNQSDQVVVLFNMEGWQLSHAKYYSFIKKLAGIFQDQYPERLYQAYFLKAPWIFQAAWAVISTFVNKRTAAKVFFVGDDNRETTLLSDLDVADVPAGYGGTREEAYPIPNAPGEENVEQVVLKK